MIAENVQRRTEFINQAMLGVLSKHARYENRGKVSAMTIPGEILMRAVSINPCQDRLVESLMSCLRSGTHVISALKFTAGGTRQREANENARLQMIYHQLSLSIISVLGSPRAKTSDVELTYEARDGRSYLEVSIRVRGTPPEAPALASSRMELPDYASILKLQ